MSRRILWLLVAVVAVVSVPAWAQNPTVTGVTMTQGAVPGSPVTINYTLASPDGPCTVTAMLSKDSGLSYAYPITTATGDVGGGVIPGAKVISWDINTDYPNEIITTARVKIVAVTSNNLLNGTFADTSAWTTTASWAIAGGVATKTGNNVQVLTQTGANQSIPVIVGETYTVTYTSTVTAGTGFTPSLGTQAGTIHVGGTWSETIKCAGNNTLTFTPGNIGTRGTIDNVSVIPTSTNRLSNGTFTGNTTGWTLAAGWAYGTNNVVRSAAAVSSLSQPLANQAVSIVIGQTYLVSYTVSGTTAGTGFQVSLGTATGKARAGAGTFTESITCAGNTTFGIAALNNLTTGTIDNVSVVPDPQAERIVNGTFTGGTTPWTTTWVYQTASDPTGEVLRTAAGQVLQQTNANMACGGVATGRRYTVSYNLVTCTQGVLQLNLGGTLSANTNTLPGTYTESIVCGATPANGLSLDSAIMYRGIVDNISVRPGSEFGVGYSPADTSLNTSLPSVTDVTSTLANGTYGVGQVVPITVTFSRGVTYTPGTGAVELLLETGTTDRIATYVGGSGTSALTFSYTVQSGDASPDLDYVGAGSLTLTGTATIKDSTSGTMTASLTLPAVGAAGSIGANKAIVIDAIAPTGTVSINAGATYTTSTAVTLDLSATDTETSVIEMQFSNNNTAWSGWESYAVTKSWTLSSGDGAKTVYVQYRDLGGNVSAGTISDGITLDATAPTGTVSVNAGAAYTASASVTLTLTSSDAGSGVADMQFSDDNTSWSGWEPVGVSKSWPLPVGDGAKTVYVQYRDVAGNVSTATISDGITLDTTAPTGTVSVNAGAAYTGSTSVTLTLTSADAGSGVADMQFSNDGSSWNGWEAAGLTKTWSITPGEGAKTVYVQYRDTAGNVSTGTISDGISLDTTAPTGSVLIDSGSTYAKTTSVSLTLGATDFASGPADMQFSNNNTTWSGWETFATSKNWALSAGDGLKTVYVEYRDAVGNVSTGTISASITLDTKAPIPTVTAPASPSNANPLNFTIDFGESVTGLSEVEITVTNGTAGTLSGSGASYTLPVTPTADGPVTVQVIAAAAQDVAGNDNVASNVASVESDLNVPTVVVSSAVSVTNAAPIDFTITFSESVTGLTAGDITVTNGTKGALTGSGATYSISVTPTLEGAVTLEVPAAAAQDKVNYDNTASNVQSVEYDITAPDCTITGPPSPTNDVPIIFTLTFTESVSGLAVDDIVVNGATVNSLSGTGSSYTLSVNAIGDGAVDCSLAAGLVADAAGNTNNVATPANITYDGTQPTITLSSSAGDPVNGAITVAVALDEDSVNFDASDLAGAILSDASTSGFGSTGARDYSFTLTPTITGTGSFSVQIPAGVFTDAAGNANTASNVLVRGYDDTPPTATLSSTSASLVSGAVTVDVALSATPTGFAAGDIAVTNANVSNLTGTGTSWSFTLTPIADGAFTAEVSAASFTDSIGNLNTVSNTVSFTYDSVAPQVISVAVQSGLTVLVTFNEPMDAISAAVASNYVITGLGVGSLTASPTVAVQNDIAGVEWLLSWPSGEMRDGEDLTVTVSSATDVAGNAVDAAHDSGTDAGGAIGVVPTITVTSQTVNDQTPLVSGTAFDEGGLGDIQVTVNGVVYAASVTNLGSGNYEWTAQVTNTLPWAIYNVAAVVTDAAGNTGSDSTTNELTLDPDAPTTVQAIAVVEDNPTNLVTVHFEVTFSLPVTGVDVSDFALHAGSIADAAITNVTGSGDTWTVTVTTGTSDGAVAIDLVDDNTVLDNLGHALGGAVLNDGDFTTGQSYTVDHSRPQVTLSAASLNTNTAPITVGITLSESVSGFVVGDLVAGHASLSNFTEVTPTQYSVKLTPDVGYQGALTLDVPADVAEDDATNGNDAAIQLSVVYDTVAPTVAISAPTELVATGGTVSYFLTYTGATSVNLTLANIHLIHTGTATANISAIMENGWIREIVLDNIKGSGDLSISVDAATSSDDAGNTDAGIASGVATPFKASPGMPVAGGLGLVVLAGAFAWGSVRRMRRK